eukprot:g2944.t1
MDNSEDVKDELPDLQLRGRRVRRSTVTVTVQSTHANEESGRTQRNRKTQDYDLVIPSESGTAGQILRVKLVNFMCHGNFEIYLKKHVNFIYGRNGSGKSSILQAIQLCLGCTARETGRGSNLSTFVKTGCSSGKILVSIWNTGTEAYRKHLYGRVITVEKSISTSSTYHLIGEFGHRASCKKGELETMMEHLGISCDNPSVVLTQEAAGGFLRNRQLSSNLYSLYMKVTEFEAIAEQHAEASDSLKASRAMIEEEKNNLEVMKNQIDSLVARTEAVREQQSATIRLHHFRNAVGYFSVQEHNQSVTAQQHELQQHNRVIADNEAELTRRQQVLSQLREEKEAFNAQTQLREVNQALDLLKRQQTDLLMSKREAERDTKEPQRRLDALQRDIDDLNEDIKDRQKRLEMIKDDDGVEVAAARAIFEQKVQTQSSLLVNKESNLTNVRQSQNESKLAFETKKNELQQISDHCRVLDLELGRINESLAKLQQSQGDPLFRFGGEVIKQVRQSIHRNISRFDRPPIGPLGKYLSVKDDLWSTAIEFAVGRLFTSFVVHSQRDEKLLRDLFKHVSRTRNLTIIVCPFDRRPYDIGEYENLSILTIKKVLQITAFEYTHIVSNMLVDYGSIERTGLANSEDEALSFVTRGGSPISQFWLPTGRRVYKTRYGHASVHDGRQLQPRLVKDTSRLMERLQTELQQTKSKLENSKKQKHALQSEARMLEQEFLKTTDTAVELDLVLQMAKDELNQLKERGPELPPSARYTSDQIEQDLSDLYHRLQLKRNELTDVTAELEYKKQQVKNINDQMLEKKEMLKQTAEDVGHKKTEYERLSSKIDAAKDSLLDQEVTLETLVNKRTLLEDALEQLKETLTELESTAKEQCDPEQFQESLVYLKDWCKEFGFPEDQLDARVAKKQISTLKRMVRNLQMESNDSYEELMAQVEEKTTQLDQQTQLVKEQDEAYLKIEAGHHKREELYHRQQQKMAKRVSDHFKKYMRKRGHSGQIKIDHANMRVQILVRPAGQQHGSTDMATLSGGERSYTTVSLLMSFASVVSSPFHCMDEFDVFTDVMTKHYSMKILLETAATEKFNSQFIFFSPLEVAAVDDARKTLNEEHRTRYGELLIPNEFIEIHNMPDPRR